VDAADREGARQQGASVLVVVRGVRAVRGRVVGMQVQVADAVVRMHVDVHAAPAQAPEHVGAERDQHAAGGDLEAARHPLRQRRAERDQGAAEQQQRPGVAAAPDRRHLHSLAPRARAAGQRGHRRDVVGLQRVPQPDQQAEEQDREHGGDSARCAGAVNRAGPG
jgi:hypothetical protein